jgi:hypothetical protein
MKNQTHPKDAEDGWRWLNPDMGCSTLSFLLPILAVLAIVVVFAIRRWLG